MPEATLNGYAVNRATLTVPLTGAWVLDVETEAEVPVTGAVELVHDGTTRWAGTVVRGAVVDLRWSGRIVGGGGGFTQSVGARLWRSVPVRLIVQDLLEEVGETLSASSAVDVLGTMLPLWTRRAGRAADALCLLCDEFSVPWRVQSDGTVFIADPLWLPYEPSVDAMGEDAVSGSALFGLDAPSLEPGMTLRGRRVGGLQYTFDDDLQARVWWAP